MTTNSVLDACAILAYLRNEPGGAIVKQLLDDPAVTCFMHSINLCEVYYQAIRASGETIADQQIADMFAVGVIDQCDMDEPFWKRVGELKSRGGIALPDLLRPCPRRTS